MQNETLFCFISLARFHHIFWRSHGKILKPYENVFYSGRNFTFWLLFPNRCAVIWELKAFLVQTHFWHPRLMLIKAMLSFQVMATPVLSVHYSDWITYYCPQCLTPEIIAQPTSERFVFALRHPYPISLLFFWQKMDLSDLSQVFLRPNHFFIFMREALAVLKHWTIKPFKICLF